MKEPWAKGKVFCKKDGQDTYDIANYYYICNVDGQHSAPTSHLADSIQSGRGILPISAGGITAQT